MTDIFPYDPPEDYPIDINPPSIYRRYTEITGVLTTFWSADKIDDLVEDYGESNVIWAMEQAAKNQVSNLNYISMVLKNALQRGEIVIEHIGADYASWND